MSKLVYSMIVSLDVLRFIEMKYFENNVLMVRYQIPPAD